MIAKRLLTLPAVGIVLDALLTGGDVLIMLAAETFTALAITTGWIAPEVSFLNQETMGLLTTVAGTLYVVHILRNVDYDRIKKQFN